MRYHTVLLGIVGLVAGAATASAADQAAALQRSFRGQLSPVSVAAAEKPAVDDLDLPAMAKAALNYLRGNPDPARNYECKFCLGPLGIPCFKPDLPPTAQAVDVISLADTDCRMQWQYTHMREMAGEPTACPVELGVERRVVGYLHADGLAWVNPAAWVGGGVKPVDEDWATTWGTGKILVTLAERYRQNKDPADREQARRVFAALKRLAVWDGPRAYYPAPTPWRNGQWLRIGWAATHCHNYPSVVEPLVRYYECTGDRDGLALARAFAEGFLAGAQPDMGDQRIDPQTGAFKRHVHIHMHAVWGVAHLGAVCREPRYLDWARKAYEFVLANGTDYGWYPEFIPQHTYQTEICVVGDMTSIAAWLARGGRPAYWDHVERTVRNEIRRSQFALTPAFLRLFHEIHRQEAPAVVQAALAELRKLEGGFVAQSTFDDWVGFPHALGKPGRTGGIHMMGCCPPEGMRALWEAYCGVVEPTADGVQVNLCLTRDHPAARVTAYRPACGRLDVMARRSGNYLLRPPAWALRDAVRLSSNGRPVASEWAGPGRAYLRCTAVQPGDRLTLRWPVPRFTQTFTPTSVPGRSDKLTVHWIGNEVVGVEPRGTYLPMFEKN